MPDSIQDICPACLAHADQLHANAAAIVREMLPTIRKMNSRLGPVIACDELVHMFMQAPDCDIDTADQPHDHDRCRSHKLAWLASVALTEMARAQR